MPDSVREKLAKAFNISQDEILSWVLVDKYCLEILELALAEK